MFYFFARALPQGTLEHEMHLIQEYSDPQFRSQVIELWNAVFGYETEHNRPSVAIDKKLAVKDGLLFVALREGAVMGTVLAGYDGHRGWLYSVAVHPAFRNQGVGRALVRHAEMALELRGCMKINLQILQGNASVAAFYESLGYAVEPRISMGRKITANIPPTASQVDLTIEL